MCHAHDIVHAQRQGESHQGNDQPQKECLNGNIIIKKYFAKTHILLNFALI